MSHFTLIVVGTDIDEQLAPYEESTSNRELLEFQDEGPGLLDQYITKPLEYIRLADGQLKHTFDDMFKKDKSPLSFDREYIYPEDSQKITGTYKHMYPTFEIFAKEYAGYEPDESNGKYGYWTNPNAKWDWYQVGGRWAGFFKMKKGGTGQVGDQSLVVQTKVEANMVDIVQVKDIDFASMEQNAAIEANEAYDALEAVLQGRPMPSWAEVLKQNNDNVDVARAVYHNLDVIKDLNKAQIHVFGELKDYYKNSREEFVSNAIKSVCVPFAILNEGQWMERGQMGWFGVSHNETDRDDWNSKCHAFLKSLHPETQLTLVDCHI